ncbi:MAG: ATP-binding cassette domain-containing protein [Verrucomicrobiota bacterium]|jgi:ABC-type transporter Mla maintaining outer membrane lipid asymmetry ATPase subunit MlaF
MDNARIKPEVPVIEMTGVSVGSRANPDLPFLENVNWSVRPGEYCVIGGLHGSGKTDFLSLIAGLTPPLQGSYRLFGQEMPVQGDKFLAERLRIGLVFDGGQLFHRLTIEENIALPLRYHRILARADLDQSVNTMLELTGLSPQAGRLPGQAGRAWQKRAGLARALVLQPEVLLLDNPLGGLDSHHVQWWLGTLDQLSSGSRFFEGRPMTLVITAEDLRPWRNRPASFAILKKRQFCPLGHHPQLGRLTDPLVKELLAEPLGAE